MKEALYYAIRTAVNRQHVVAVTSEKPSRYGQTRWYGRRCEYNEATNGKSSDIEGRFNTREAAEARLKEVTSIKAKYAAIREPLNDAVSKSFRDEADEIKAACNRA